MLHYLSRYSKSPSEVIQKSQWIRGFQRYRHPRFTPLPFPDSVPENPCSLGRSVQSSQALPWRPLVFSLLAGIRRIFFTLRALSSAQSLRSSARCRSAEKKTHLDRRRGGGTMARAKSKRW